MNERSASEQMAYDDVFVTVVLIGIGLFATRENWLESDWWGLFGTVMLTLFSGLWLAARIYHLTHKDEVFGVQDPTDV